MNWSHPISWLSALMKRRTVSRAGETDCADMGTAFGLDASFGPVDGEPPVVGDARATQPPRPWEHRLTRRVGL